MLLHEPSGSVWQVTADPGEAKAHAGPTNPITSFLNVCQILWKVLTRISLFRFYFLLRSWGLTFGGSGIMPGDSCDGAGAACSGTT